MSRQRPSSQRITKKKLMQLLNGNRNKTSRQRMSTARSKTEKMIMMGMQRQPKRNSLKRNLNCPSSTRKNTWRSG